MDLKLYIGNKIKHLRTLHGMTQTELAEKLFTTKQTVSRYENGQRSADQDVLFELCEIFNVSINDFFPQQHSNTPTTLSSGVQAILDVSVQLETPRQHNVLTYAKNQLQEQSKIIQVDFSVKEEETEYQTVYLYGAASAGKGLDLYDEVIEEIQYPKPVPTHDIALRVHGDSMEPMFRDDEIIFVKKSHEINHGQIGVFILNGQGYLKKFYRDADGLKLVSLNKEYDDIVVQEFDEIQLTGVVVM